MKILIIGASGLIGGACFKLFSQDKKNIVVGTYFGFAVEGLIKLDTLSGKDSMVKTLGDFEPEIIIHTGALTHVDLCETNQKESHQSTVVSTNNVLELAENYNSKVVYISTDYIFDGLEGPYSETARTHPLSVYGNHKLEAENLVLKSSEDNLSIRVTNVYGDEIRGKNFVSRLISFAKDGEIHELNLPVDQYATPVNAEDVAKCINLLLVNQHSGIWNCNSTDYLNRVQLSLKVLQYYPSEKVIIHSKTTEELNQNAVRPLMGGLVNLKFCKHFPDFIFTTLDSYLSTKSA